MKKILKILLLVGLGLTLLVVNYLLMAKVFFGPTAAVRAALESDLSVAVSFREEDTWLVLQPVGQTGRTGLIFYAENYQEIRTYAPILRRLANDGYAVVGLSRREKFPPTLEQEEQRIAQVMAAFPQVSSWFIGAHSWEARLAAAYASRHASLLDGIVLWAGRLSPETSLAESPLPVLMVYGTRDDENEDLLTWMKPLLPPQTIWVSIGGGNRVNFANFGPMSRDVGASIPAEQQQSEAAVATLDFIDQVQK